MESMTDLQQHIRKRLTEIEDLDERKDAREILLEGLVPIFERMEKRYLDLENQIKREIEIPNEKYAVSMTVITQKDYDPINGTLYPVVPALLQEDKEQEESHVFPECGPIADLEGITKATAVSDRIGDVDVERQAGHRHHQDKRRDGRPAATDTK